jgi:hypothetical protein
MWPRGYLADAELERSKGVKEITKVLAKTILLSYVSDELRHILGADTTRRGIFDLFDLFQHETLNKRFLNLLIENLLVQFYPTAHALGSSCQNGLITSPPASSSMSVTASPQTISYSNNVVFLALRLHLSKSDRVKQEWKLAKNNMSQQYTVNLQSNNLPFSAISATPSPFSMMSKSSHKENNGGEEQDSKGNLPRSKSLFNEIKC